MTLALANYHTKLRDAVLADVPDTAGDSAFLADGELSDTEIAALDRAQSVFGLETFYRAWELDELTPNQIHAVLHILTFYDPYTTVHDVTADPDDPDAEGAELTRALDDFGVYPGACLYCKGLKSSQSSNHVVGLFRRMVLLRLAHHAKVQADALSPCDLRDFTEEELVALEKMESTEYALNVGWEGAYGQLEYNFVASARLTDELLEAGIDYVRLPQRSAAPVLIRPGEVLSPFTHAMRAAGGPPSERGLKPCLEAVKKIVEWDANRYYHFLGYGYELVPFFRGIFPTNRVYDRTYPMIYEMPTWAWFLVEASGGQDKSKRLMNQFRALNLPAVRERHGIYFDETAAEASTAKRVIGIDGVLLAPYHLYLHRNIGFSRDDYQADTDDLIRRISFPEQCRIERIAPGSLERREHPGYTTTYRVWTRDPSSTELHGNLVYVCD